MAQSGIGGLFPRSWGAFSSPAEVLMGPQHLQGKLARQPGTPLYLQVGGREERVRT